MLKKQLYAAPEAELLVVRFEENFLVGTNTGESFDNNNMAGGFEEED